MFMFGTFFDTDPQYESVTCALAGTGSADEMDRADRLHEKAVNYVDHVSGPQHVYERFALAKVSELGYENGIRLAGLPASDLIGVLHRFYPEKCRYIRESAVTALVREGYAMAAKRGPSWIVGSPLLVGLMFTFGHGCFADPQYPWIARVLDSDAPTDAAAALEGLFRKFLLYLERAKTNLDK